MKFVLFILIFYFYLLHFELAYGMDIGGFLFFKNVQIWL